MVLVHHDRCFDRYSLLYSDGAIGVHFTMVDGVVLDYLHSLLDPAEYDGLVRARERVGQVLFLEPYC